MVTIGKHILKRYAELEKVCIEQIGRPILPPVLEIDEADIVTLVVTFFSKEYETENYKPTLINLVRLKGASIDELEMVYPDAKLFTSDVLRVLKSKL